MANLKQELIKTNNYTIDLNCGGFNESIRFVETHRNDIRTSIGTS